MDMNNFYSSFGFIDIIVICVGVYGFYSWYMLLKKHEIKKMLLIGGSLTPEQCTDVEGFAGYIGNKLLILSADLLVFGTLSAYNSYVKEIGMVLWIGMAVFLAIIVWYCVCLRKANEQYFNPLGKSGKSIKDKAMKK